MSNNNKIMVVMHEFIQFDFQLQIESRFLHRGPGLIYIIYIYIYIYINCKLFAM